MGLGWVWRCRVNIWGVLAIQKGHFRNCVQKQSEMRMFKGWPLLGGAWGKCPPLAGADGRPAPSAPPY